MFLADLETHRDRAVVMLMLLGGLRASEVRSLRLADVDLGMRQVTVTGKGNKQRTVPVDRAFFTEPVPICASNGPLVCARRSASWCCAAQPPARR